MNSKSFFRVALCLGVVAVASMCFAADDQTPEPGDFQALPADKCAAIQQQIDEIVAIGESTTLSDEEKIAQLTASWTKSLANLFKASAGDPDSLKMAQEMASSFNALLSTAGSADKNAAPNAARDLELMKQRTRPYVAIMKLLCPDITVPKVMGK